LFLTIFGALLAFVTLGAAFVAVSRGASLEFLRLLLPEAVYFAFALLLTRNVVLAALVALAPLAGATWSLALDAPIDPSGRDLNLGVALGSVLALVFVDEFENRIATDTDLRHAVVAGLGAVWRPAAGALVPAAGAVAHIIHNHGSGGSARALLSPMTLSVLAVLALVPAGSTFMSLDESVIARINRAREWRMRAAFPLTLSTMPRWGLSVSGAGLVLCVMSYFGAERLVARDGWVVLATVLASLLASLTLVRDWRMALGLGFSLTVTALMGLWASVLGYARSSFDAIGFYEALAIGFALMIGVAQRDVSSQGAPIGLVHGLEERAAVVLSATASVLIALLLTGRLDLVTATVVVAGALCSLLLVTAVASALETVVPRGRSVAELYGRKP
jgi:hypothetical protein